MPELPDITIYVERIEALVVGHRLERIRLRSPFVLRSFDPPLDSVNGLTVRSTRRLGKQIVLGLGGELYVLIHLMVAGRLRWREACCGIPKSNGLAAFDFPNGSLLFTEHAKKKRASIHIVRGNEVLAGFDRGGLEVLTSSLAQFGEALTRENHTLKRAFTDPRILSGIGNAYSDEILHRARLSPAKRSQQLLAEELERLHAATRDVLNEWTKRHRERVGDGFPERVTAFHDEMAVHGRYGKPCPVCASPVQRIVYAENECNYCPTCQTGGKLLADRSLSRLLKSTWPRTLEELESTKQDAHPGGLPRAIQPR